VIGYIRGQLIENAGGRMLVAVGPGGALGSDAGAIGYAVTVPQQPGYDLIAVGATVELFIHTHVREDALDLYGFLSRGEKELFLTLLEVNGIGPKVALGVLSKVVAQDFIEAVAEGDKDALTQVPGIGKKTAERMVLELGDKVRKKLEAGLFGKVVAPPPAAGAKGAGAVSGKAADRAVMRDAKDALIGLGYREQEIQGLLKELVEDAAAPPRVEDLIRSALQRLST
jgi:Holliday junction DNA helicase RuvA